MIEYRFEPELHRSAAYDGSSCIGECDYVDRNGAWAITHTEVDPTWGGQGIARQLVLMVAQEAENQDIPVIPVCCYAVHVLG
ncbi:GNAT family N-acetyltransferase [Faecalibaculum rodentium]|uniref:Glutaredoxin n=1 Tax=Faecalibaculum rodentium TaxID=1702221 RepID=A0A140DS88_9FIRM|nr:GNAT family N-acetyltransferase [Faecalibaculum rodentium]AMK53515.1 glutaredoxin [Faecalibaculum rodentium]